MLLILKDEKSVLKCFAHGCPVALKPFTKITICSLSVTVTKTMTESNSKKALFHLKLPGHSPSLMELGAGLIEEQNTPAHL